MREAANNSQLTIETVEYLRSIYAPTASLIATMNAVAKHWPRPALVLTATFKGRKHDAHRDKALRIAPQGRNSHANKSGLYMYPNMRVPASSPIFTAYNKHQTINGSENLITWITSSGSTLPNIEVFTSATGLGDIAYATISI